MSKANLPGLSSLSLFLLLISVLIPATATFELFPHWDLDPTTTPVPSTGLQPLHTLALAALTTLAAALALLASARSNQRLLTAQLTLAALGSAGILYHGVFSPSPAMGTEHLIHATPWLALAAAWIAAAHLCRDPRLRAITLALIASLTLPFLAKALHQLLVEHPATLADFTTNKDQILDSKGWAPGSSNALAYERRLVQSEASAWFGLTNVAATFAAATTAGLLALLAAPLATRFFPRKRGPGASLGSSSPSFPSSSSSSTTTSSLFKLPTPQLLTLALTTLAAAAFLILTKSKGGLGALAISLAAVSALILAHRFKANLANRLAPALGPLVIAAVLALVALRGLLGESLSELSLLFRSQYALGALRIWADTPLTGVGPASFQDAYALFKPALSPETVQSPHSALLDWTATLGLFGLAWAAWLGWQSTNTARQLIAQPTNTNPSPRPDRDTLRLTAFTVALTSLASIFIARELATPEFALMHLAALAAWLSAAVLLLPVFLNTRHAAVFSAAAALALLAHIQIEVTPVWTNAAPLLGLFLGATLANTEPATSPKSAPRASGGTPNPTPLKRLRAYTPALLTTALALTLLAFPVRTALNWQTALTRAAHTVRPAAEARADLNALLTDPDPTAQRARTEGLAGYLSIQLGTAVPPRPDALDQAISLLRLRRLLPAADALDAAIAARPAHTGTTIAQGRLLIDTAINHPDRQKATAAIEAALAAALKSLDQSGSTSSLDWAAVTHERAAYILARLGQPDRRDPLLLEALALWQRLDARTPHSVRSITRIMDLADRLGPDQTDPDLARNAAAEALRRDELTRLDPVTGLTDAQRAQARRILNATNQPGD